MKFESIKSKIYDRLLDTGLSTDECVAAANDIAKMVEADDFGALLAEAKAKHSLMTSKVNECQYSESRLTEMHDAQNDWHDWCKKNLTDRGIRMTVKADTGEPRGLFVVVAGSDC